jgi:hypothetical protein
MFSGFRYFILNGFPKGGNLPVRDEVIEGGGAVEHKLVRNDERVIPIPIAKKKKMLRKFAGCGKTKWKFLVYHTLQVRFFAWRPKSECKHSHFSA